MTSTTINTTPQQRLYDAVAAAVASSPPLQPDEIPLSFTRFRDAYDETGGTLRQTTWEAWVWSRTRAAASPAPCSDKRGYPSEIGALLDGRGKKAENVQMLTWLLLDADKGDDFAEMEAVLRKLGLAFLIVESSSSQLDGKPVKWHCYMPVVPIEMPSRSTPGIDYQRTVDEVEAWWRQVHTHLRHVFGMLGASSCTGGELYKNGPHFPGVRFDSATDKLAQQTFVSHRPFGKDSDDDRYVASSGGRVLSIADVITATASLVGDIAASPRRPDAVIAQAGSATTQVGAMDRPQQGGGGEAPPEATGASLGPTPNETTGTLVYQALDHFGLVGRRHDENSYMTLCPWREHHSSEVRRGTQDNYNDSVLVFTRGERAGEDGGFICLHTGRGVAGECSQAGAADVLRWARKRGAAIPDRPEWGGTAAEMLSVPSEAAQNSDVVAPVVDFDTAPIEHPTIEAAEDAAPDAITHSAPKPRIEITNNLVEMARAAIDAVAQHSKVYTRNGVLVDVVIEDDKIVDRYGLKKRPRIRMTTKPYLHAIMSDCADWYTLAMTKKGQPVENATRPDKDVVAAMLSAGTFGRVRRLEDIVYTPTFRKDGTLLDVEGYDQSSGLLFRDEIHVPSVSRDPTRQELLQARAKLLEPLADFPFRKDAEAVCRAVWVSTVFTPFLRYTFVGNKPMFVVSANRSGGGKTKLVNVATLISEGRPAAMSGKVLGDDGELERILGMHVEAQTPALCIDNIPIGTRLASSALESFITTPDYTTRKIGTSAKIKSTYFDGMLWATANMLETGGDMLRRILRIDIEDRSDNPAHRVVSIPDLEAHVKADRRAYVHAVLTLLCGYFAAVRRGVKVELPAGGFGSFEGWSDVVRKAVVWCGFPDPVYARGKAGDDGVSGFGFLMTHLRQCYAEGNLIGNIAKALVKNRSAAKRDEALAAFDGHLVDEGVALTGQSGDSTKLGKHLARYNGLVWVDTEAKRWQLVVTKRSSGSHVVVVAVDG